MKQIGFHVKNFYEIPYFGIFPKSVEKIPFSLQPNKITGTLHEDL